MTGFLGKYDVSSAWVFSLATGELKPLLVPGEGVYRGQTGLGRIVGISSDAKYVFMPAFSGNADVRDKPPYSLFRVNLENPKRPRMGFPGNRRSSDFLIDSRGETLVHEYLDDSGQRHVIAARNGEDWKEIYAHDSALREISAVGLTRDYASLVVGSYDEDTRRRSYYTMALADGAFTGRIFGRDDADVDDVYMDINRVVYGVRYSGFTPGYEFLDATVTARVSEIADLVRGNSVWLVDWTRDWQSLVVYVEGPAFSGQYFVLTEGAEPALLTNARPGFDDDTIHPVVEFSYKAADGLRIPTLLTIPRHSIDALKNLPAVMLPHGGPAAHDSIGFDWFAQALADEGYLVIQPQFRGSTGFGLDHRAAGKGEWGRKMQSDLSDGLAALVAKAYVDPARVCIVGMSYGGYAALAGGAFQPVLWRCVVSINGVADLNRMVDHDAFWSNDSRMTRQYFAHTLGVDVIDRKYLDSISPSEHAEAFTVPVLLIHGKDDEIVSIGQSKAMRTRLDRTNKEVVFIELPDAGHGLRSYKSRVRTVRETVDFVNRYLAGSP
jgi:dipeptidyl aminopeptidase/acylaminoacyl peptidase